MGTLLVLVEGLAVVEGLNLVVVEGLEVGTLLVLVEGLVVAVEEEEQQQQEEGLVAVVAPAHSARRASTRRPH